MRITIFRCGRHIPNLVLREEISKSPRREKQQAHNVAFEALAQAASNNGYSLASPPPNSLLDSVRGLRGQ